MRKRKGGRGKRRSLPAWERTYWRARKNCDKKSGGKVVGKRLLTRSRGEVVLIGQGASRREKQAAVSLACHGSKNRKKLDRT